MGFNLREIDHGWKEIRKMVKRAAQGANYAKAGVLGDGETAQTHGKAPHPNRDGEPLTNVEIAVIHEFGSPAAGIPERSFVRSAFELHYAHYLEMLRVRVPAILELKTDINSVLGILGARMSSDMKNLITTEGGHPIPLAPATIARKGSSVPLVDTGQLLNSITWAVAKGPRV